MRGYRGLGFRVFRVWGFPKLGVPFGVPIIIKNYSILGVYIGVPLFRETAI